MFENYDPEVFFDEAVSQKGEFRAHYSEVAAYFNALTDEQMQQSIRSLERAFLKQGVTFTVYFEGEGTERIFPFDPMPRVIPHTEWVQIDAGLRQRIKALNAFLKDVYSEQAIFEEIPELKRLVESSKHYRKELCGVDLPHDVYIHICGSDLIRGEDGQYYVLEDNGRCPSGVSYMMENRVAMKRTFPELYRRLGVEKVSHYPDELAKMLRSVTPRQQDDPVAVLLTPGHFNSAYFEHTFLAQQMGIEIVEGRDLVVENDRVYMYTTQGLEQVDVIYRRIDDAFLDPEYFRPDSALGVPGLMRAYLAGNVNLVNAVGTGIADDKATYAYVPDMIRHYLGEEPILPNIKTYLGSNPEDLQYMLDNIEELVIKAVDEAGGYGMLVGPASTPEQCEVFREKIQESPRGFIGQPTIALSRQPTFCDGVIEGRHVDLRPFILSGEETVIVPGGLTRVALKKGSLVVNSSQGGGSKDTWVLRQ